jgi:type VI secretion system Hcp family effector
MQTYSRASWVGLCGVLLMMTGVPVNAAMTAYMTIEGVKQGKFKDEIRLNSVVHDATARPATVGGRRQLNPIEVTKPIGPASPQLRQALTTSETLREVVISFQRPGGGPGKQKAAEKIVLTNARIVGIRNASNGLEEISFTYEQILVTYVTGGTTATDDWLTP